MGDKLPDEPFPAETDVEKVVAAVDAAFEPAQAMTAGFVVTRKGRIIGERYGDGIDMHTPLESWSMGKGITASLMGIMKWGREGSTPSLFPLMASSWSASDTSGAHGREGGFSGERSLY